ncbi:MAG TPA: STAS domain-containing protein [Segeticoccus sp.]|uniref:STAS domain-containing protein n=1 Tax=Segeticoccus sp. TaxID=2706531 RepID=UPI002D80C013|nr:STAS domain-containing protein [Segeticoccus sp.]HET8601026.1 STAS domain-containing protein [Segeticoccus sp.]
MTVIAAGAHTVDVTEDHLGRELTVSGRLDVHTVADVRLLLHRAVDDGDGDLLLHLRHAEVGDATGLGVIVGAHNRARRAGRRLVLVDASPRLERLLRASRLSRVLARPDAASLTA